MRSRRAQRPAHPDAGATRRAPLGFARQRRAAAGDARLLPLRQEGHAGHHRQVRGGGRRPLPAPTRGSEMHARERAGAQAAAADRPFLRGCGPLLTLLPATALACCSAASSIVLSTPFESNVAPASASLANRVSPPLAGTRRYSRLVANRARSSLYVSTCRPARRPGGPSVAGVQLTTSDHCSLCGLASCPKRSVETPRKRSIRRVAASSRGGSTTRAAPRP